jgi:hypothetical protein
MSREGQFLELKVRDLRQSLRFPYPVREHISSVLKSSD